MAARIRSRALPLGLSAAAFAVALLQRPGWSSSDTKIDLHTDPVRFLGEIASLWTPSSGLGGVESAQYAGYLFPMGPLFAAGHWLGVSDWLVDRLWLGLLLAAGCWGVVRLLEALGATRSWYGGLAGGAVYLLNPYVVVFTNRTTITLLAYALLPWLALVAWRGVRRPSRWGLPALFALLVTASGGGVNAAVTGLVLLGPLALVAYDAVTRQIEWRDAWSFGWRAALATLAASLWWIAPGAAQAAYGVDFLRFTEPAGAIWATTSLSESFRAMGYWISYIGVGFDQVIRPYFSDSGVMLFAWPVVWATFLVPAAGLLGFGSTRRRRYAGFFLLLVLLGTLVMAVGFPEGTPLRRGATFAYNHFGGVRFLRTTYKAGPLVVLGTAGLIAMACEHAVGRIAAAPWGRSLVAAAAAAGCLVLALSAWPLVRGTAVDRQVAFKRVPAAWTAAAHNLDHSLGDDQRAVVLPGQLYAFYRWGGTVDPILPSLSRRPVAVRNAVPYGDLRGTDLLWTADALLQQRRLLPGQLPGLLGLMSAGALVSASDDDVGRSGAVEPAVAARELARQGLGTPLGFGPLATFRSPGEVGRPLRLPEVRSYRVPGSRPLVRVEPRSPLTVLDGSAEGLADLYSLAALGARTPLAYAGDLAPRAIAAAARSGGTIVVSDSNRRRVQVVSRMRQNTGATLAAGDPISQDAATLDPFPERGSAGQTVAVLHGARYIRAPFSPGFAQFPENRPYAAFDGDPATAWYADRSLAQARHWLEIGFTRPRDVAAIDVLPAAPAGAVVAAVDVGGKRFRVRPGWAHLKLALAHVSTLRIRVETTRDRSAAAAGLAELRIAGLRVTESLRPPLLAERALRSRDLSRATLAYAFSRSTGDSPWRRTATAGTRIPFMLPSPELLEAARVRRAGDEESAIDRVIAPPAARAWRARAWVSASPEAGDSSLDRLAGYRGAVVADGSARFEGRPAFRASSALDGDPLTQWLPYLGAGSQPLLRVRLPHALTLRRLTILPARPPAHPPTAVRVGWPGHVTAPLPVGGGGVLLPEAARTRSLTVRIVRTGYGTVDATGFAELRIPGVRPLAVPRKGALATGCGELAMATAGGLLKLAPQGGARTLDAGRPMRARSCGPPLRLPAGTQRVRARAGRLRVDKLLLTSPAPAPVARASGTPGRVTNVGRPGRGKRDGVRLSLHAPAWLVLGESFARGWRASCDGHSLGPPVPLDGYANAWRVGPDCHRASFEFAPQRPVRIVQLLSALACLVLLAIALSTARQGPDLRPAVDCRPAAPPSRPSPRQALVAGLALGAVLAFCFSLRSGLVIAPALALVLWRGIPAGPLAVAAGLLLGLVVPLLYALVPSDDHGGYNPGYAGDHVAGHWVAVAAWVLLALALWRTISTARAAAARAPRSAP